MKSILSKVLQDLTLFFITTATVILFWWGFAKVYGESSKLIPSPWEIVNALCVLATKVDVYYSIASTLFRCLLGFLIASILGVNLGLLIASSKPMAKILLPSIDFLRSIPVTTLYPMFVVFAGIGDYSKIAMVIYACVFVIMVNTISGVLNTPQTRHQMASIYGMSRSEKFFHVTFFQALPNIFDGMRIALSLSLIVTILTEMFMGCKYGIGQQVIDFYTTFNVASMFAVVLYTGMIGYLLNKTFRLIEKKTVFWQISA